MNKITIHFSHISVVLNDEISANIIANILLQYYQLIEKLKSKILVLNLELKTYAIDERVHNHIKKCISKTVDKLGQREKNVAIRTTIKDQRDTDLVDSIKKNIFNEIYMQTYNLEYPYYKLKDIIEQKNKNDFSRLTMPCDESELINSDVSNCIFIDIRNMKTKLKDYGIINLLSDAKVKKFVNKLCDENIYLSNILVKDIPLTLEIFENEQWKNTKKINPGSLAKVYMNYYFNKLILEKQPDVIFIDQPENDVDKTFITETLSEFIKNTKSTTQFLMTTHDPILTVNSDANKIILAELDDDNRITYSSFALEEVDVNTFKNIGTEYVSKILDGGKKNIKIRYQIYGGGEINDNN